MSTHLSMKINVVCKCAQAVGVLRCGGRAAGAAKLVGFIYYLMRRANNWISKLKFKYKHGALGTESMTPRNVTAGITVTCVMTARATHVRHAGHDLLTHARRLVHEQREQSRLVGIGLRARLLPSLKRAVHAREAARGRHDIVPCRLCDTRVAHALARCAHTAG
jgi:hypothetical protein